MIKIIYVEPIDYFPEEIRKEYGLGEYADRKTKPKKRRSRRPKKQSDGEKNTRTAVIDSTPATQKND